MSETANWLTYVSVISATIGAASSLVATAITQVIGHKNETFRANASRMQRLEDRIIDASIELGLSNADAASYARSIATLNFLIPNSKYAHTNIIAALEAIPANFDDKLRKMRSDDFIVLISSYINSVKSLR